SAWPYRGRLALSISCAVVAALLWSLSLAAIYPVQQILGNGKPLQDWVDEQIKATQESIDEHQGQVDRRSAEEKRLQQLPGSDVGDKRLRDLSRELAKVESKLEDDRRYLYRYLILRKYIYRLLPFDPFATLAWIVLWVVACTALKGIFEFGQESLVGSVVNLS